MPFYQDPPALQNTYLHDRALRSHLARALPPEVKRAVEPALEELGALAAGPLYAMMIEDRKNDPTLVQWDPWGRRVDRIELTAVWKRARVIACEMGLVATPYEGKLGAHGRTVQAALIHLFNPSTDVYTCPLAMTDGAAKTLLAHKNQPLIDRAVARLTSRDPNHAWTSGQWMTERTGGSDVGTTETVARRLDDGRYGLYGTKWFTSAATSEMALTLARPEGNPPGGKGLALFYLETRDDAGTLNHILINRLKDKLGTRKVPTAELTLEGTVATPVTGTSDGVRAITPMLNITRYWNTVCAASGMARGLALARAYAQKRRAFGTLLTERPLHMDTLAGLAAEYEAALALTLFVAELLGKDEAGELSEADHALLRLVTPLAKLMTGRQSVAVASEVLEAFGGAGYVEDTGLPLLLRDAQVLPIWEGTTNVLSLDVLRAVARDNALAPFLAYFGALSAHITDPELALVYKSASFAVERAVAWVQSVKLAHAEAGARRFALTLSRSLSLALLARHAQWSMDHERDGRARAAAMRFLRHGVDLIAREDDAHAAIVLGAGDQLPI